MIRASSFAAATSSLQSGDCRLHVGMALPQHSRFDARGSIFRGPFQQIVIAARVAVEIDELAGAIAVEEGA